ncbi:MAG: hypothetical protein HW390_2714 [Candidatus Brocadiaceae bacterium]|nr:hypothetical protein [Candidatus Brocadiaceae bacterium]
MGIRAILRTLKILPSPVTRRGCLESGFSFAYILKFSGYPFETIIEFEQQSVSSETQDLLAAAKKLGIALQPSSRSVNAEVLKTHQRKLSAMVSSIGFSNEMPEISSENYKGIRDSLSEITPEHEVWFRGGFHLFNVTALLGFDLVALSTEESREILARADVKKITSNFAGVFEDLGWKPDRIKTFFIERVAPFMWEPSLRKWVFDSNMAVMSDLLHEAGESDKKNEPPGLWERIIPAIKALIESIPIIGKPAVAILWGEKSK